jgi:hypothetical protein
LPEDLTNRQCYILEPVLATGGTLGSALEFLAPFAARNSSAEALGTYINMVWNINIAKTTNLVNLPYMRNQLIKTKNIFYFKGHLELYMPCCRFK